MNRDNLGGYATGVTSNTNALQDILNEAGGGLCKENVVRTIIAHESTLHQPCKFLSEAGKSAMSFSNSPESSRSQRTS